MTVEAPGTPRIGIIHATTLSMEPLTAALAAEFPHARIRHLLDDSLLPDLQQAGRLTAELSERMERLIAHLAADVSAVQLACSGFAPVVDRLRTQLPIPVLKPDEAMYAQMVSAGHRHVGIVATVQPSLDLAEEQLVRLSQESGAEMRISTACRSDGMRAAQAGDREGLRRAVAAAAVELQRSGADAIALAQYSMSPIADAVAADTDLPVYTGPESAARHLRTLIGSVPSSTSRGS